MNILITGAAGYIGSHMAHRLARENFAPILVDSCRLQKIPEGLIFYHCNLRNTIQLRKIFSAHQIDMVLHFAGCIDNAESVVHPEKYYLENLHGTLSLLEIMREFDVAKIIFSSSAAVYGNVDKITIPEYSAKKPCSPYGRSKWQVEQILKDYSRAYSLKVAVLRYFNVAGCDEQAGLFENHKPETHLIPIVLSAGYENRPIQIFGSDYPTSDGTCIRDFIHVLDLCDAYYKCIVHFNYLGSFTVFNVGTGIGISVRDIVSKAEEIIQKKIRIEYLPRRKGDPISLVSDPSNIKKQLNWNAHYSDITRIIYDASRGYLLKQNDN